MNKITAKTVPLSALVDDPNVNVRRSNRGLSLDELQASIKAHGIQQSLRVRPADAKGAYSIIAGHRRYAALIALRDAGDIGNGYEVPVLVGKATDAEARELSTVENVERLALTAVDEFRAFKALSDDGAGAGEIAARFGLPERRILQRLRLAELHPAVLDALEAGEITLEAAQAFTLQPDAELQRQYLETARRERRSWDLHASSVRHQIASAHLEGRSKLAQMIGEDAYVAAGGVVLTDLFGEHSLWTSADIVRQLVDAHWKGRIDAWTAEGWAFVVPASEYAGGLLYSLRHLPAALPDPEYSKKDAKRLEKIAAQLEGYEELDELDEDQEAAVSALEEERDGIEERYRREPAYTAEQKAHSGVVYREDGGGVTYGVVDPARADPGPFARDDDKPAKPAKKEDPEALTATMATALTVTMTHALQRDVAANPDMALRILVATLHTRSKTWNRAPCHISGSIADRRYGEEHPQGQDFGQALTWARGQTQDALLAYLAELVADSVDVRDTNVQDNPDNDGVEALIAYVAPDVLPLFDAEAYFAGVKKPVIVAAYKEITGTTLRDAKKAEMAAAAVERATATGWLPAQLRTAAYVGPGASGEITEEAA